MFPSNAKFRNGFAGLAIAAVAALSLSACGADKPAFCADRDSLQNSVKEAASLAASANVSELRNQINQVETDATTLVDSARTDYPDQTGEIESSVQSLQTAVKDLPESPAPAEIAGVAVQATAAISAVKNFIDATRSDCE